MQDNEKKHVDTTDDLSKDMIFEGDEYKNQEAVSHSTASEGELKTVDENQQQAERTDTFKGNEEDSTDNSVGQTEQAPDADRTQIPSLAEDEKVKREGDDITS